MSDRIQWQPIATAPRDGRLIIVYHAERGVEVTRADGDWWNSTTARGLHAIPSRWMPLPPAPCDEPRHGGDASAAPGRSPAGAVPGGQAPDLKSLQDQIQSLSTALAESERRGKEAEAILHGISKLADSQGWFRSKSAADVAVFVKRARALLFTPTQETSHVEG